MLLLILGINQAMHYSFFISHTTLLIWSEQVCKPVVFILHPLYHMLLLILDINLANSNALSFFISHTTLCFSNVKIVSIPNHLSKSTKQCIFHSSSVKPHSAIQTLKYILSCSETLSFISNHLSRPRSHHDTFTFIQSSQTSIISLALHPPRPELNHQSLLLSKFSQLIQHST